MKYLIIGLGNPGKKYEFTRHNAGKMFVAYLKHQPIEGVEAVESEEYMNHSGEWVKNLLRRRSSTGNTGSTSNTSQPTRDAIAASDKPAHVTRVTYATCVTSLIISHDDLDLPLGKVKLQFGKGPRIHNGVNSVETALRTTEFWRLRIGIDNRRPEIRDKYIGKDYVLSVLTKEERNMIIQGFEDAKMVIQRNFQF